MYILVLALLLYLERYFSFCSCDSKNLAHLEKSSRHNKKSITNIYFRIRIAVLIDVKITSFEGIGGKFFGRSFT